MKAIFDKLALKAFAVHVKDLAKVQKAYMRHELYMHEKADTGKFIDRFIKLIHWFQYLPADKRGNYWLCREQQMPVLGPQD